MKIGKIWLLALVCGLALGRENPFAPSSDINASMASSNVVENLPPFEKQNFKFPADARNFISVTLKYKSIDGSIKEKTVDINKSISWQDEFSIDKIAVPVVAPKSDVSVTKEEPKAVESAVPKPTELNMTAQEPLKDIVIKPLEKTGPQKQIAYKQTKFEIYPMQIKIFTTDEKLKDYSISKGTKVVIDFTSQTDANTRKDELDCGAFKTALFGSHGKFYRVVFDLDGSYKHAIEKTQDGYLLKLSR
ncbi:AMIN domain-containing protein [Campylobacter rectus]|uniref:AMIN domain-containing protein n=1 Tax=Campylobacter rectus TaxID=203 RepID=UPI0023F0EAAC|nr:AMIN domain-containing protein [Campylobacter rectus]